MVVHQCTQNQMICYACLHIRTTVVYGYVHVCVHVYVSLIKRETNKRSVSKSYANISCAPTLVHLCKNSCNRNERKVRLILMSDHVLEHFILWRLKANIYFALYFTLMYGLAKNVPASKRGRGLIKPQRESTQCLHMGKGYFECRFYLFLEMIRKFFLKNFSLRKSF